MAIQGGFSQSKSPVSLHITKKRRLKDSLVPPSSNNFNANLLKNLSIAVLEDLKPKCWNSVVSTMR